MLSQFSCVPLFATLWPVARQAPLFVGYPRQESWRVLRISSPRDLPCGFDPWVGKILWRRKRLPTPVFLPEESHGQRSLLGYHPWDLKSVGHNRAQM